jgi:Tfp pilus assembly protein PilX
MEKAVSTAPREANGFTLPVVILSVVVLTVLGSAAIQMSRDELFAGTAMSQSGLAFYAAESGLAATIASWNHTTINAAVPNPGDSTVGGWQTLANGCRYRTVVRRIDGAETSQKLYQITATGRGPGVSPAQRQISVIVKSPPPAVFTGAIAFGTGVVVSGNVTVRGTCAQVHANGNMTLSGTDTIGGAITSTGTVTVSGTVRDTLGAANIPQNFQPAVTLPTYNPMDYCLPLGAAGSYHFDTTGKVWKPGGTGWVNVGSAGISWKYSSGVYTTDGTNIPAGVYCSQEDLEISHDIGTAASPRSLTFLTTKSLTIPGKPVMRPYHPDGWMIVATGDLKLNGDASSGSDAVQGLLYGGAQCEISGSPQITGQLICKGGAQPAGSTNWVATNQISGQLRLIHNCPPPSASSTKPIPLGERSWTQHWN